MQTAGRLFPALGLLAIFSGCSHNPRASAPPSATPEPPPKVAARTERAPVHPAVARLSALFARSAEGGPATNGHPSEAECRNLTGFRDGEFDGCSLVLRANGTAAEVDLSYDCGGDSCSNETYVWYGADPNPYHLAHNLYPVEVSPDHRFLLYTELDYSVENSVPIHGRTLRIERATGRKEPFFDCFSAVLSPGDRYYVCRDLAANVLRVPVTGGTPEIVVRARLPPGETVKLGGPFDDFPAPVTFPAVTELEYELYLSVRERAETHRVPWRE